MQYSNLRWGPGSRSKACNSRCPRGWVTMTKNSHIAGQKTRCKSGKYAPLCAYDVIQKECVGTCYSTFSSHILSGGYSQRPDLEGHFDFRFRGDTGMPSPRTTKGDAARGMLRGRDCLGTLPIHDHSINVSARFRLETSEDISTRRATRSVQSADKQLNKPISMSDRSTTVEHTWLLEHDTLDKSRNEEQHPQQCFHRDFVLADGRSSALDTCPSVETESGLLPLLDMCAASYRVTT